MNSHDMHFISAPAHVADKAEKRVLFTEREQQTKSREWTKEELNRAEQEKQLFLLAGRFVLDIVRDFHLTEVEYIVLNNTEDTTKN